MKVVDAIFVSDPHMRDSVPVCRTDPFVKKTQFGKLIWLKNLQKKYDCPVYCGGDLFDKWNPSLWLVSWVMKYIPKQFHTIYGQHDLPQHSLELRNKSGIHALETAGKLKVLQTCSWGQKVKEPSVIIKGRKILIWHYFNYQGAEPWPGCDAPSGNTLLKKYPKFDVILTGDNHQTFIKKYKGRLLVNPGSFSRQKADQLKHKPCVFLYNAKKNEVKKVFIPIKKDHVTREHIEEIEKRDNRIDAFINSLSDEWDFSMSFDKNLKSFFSKNKTRKKIIKIIEKTLTK